MMKMNFPDESFDGVWANASILHILRKDLDNLLRKIKKILKPEGLFFLGVKKGKGKKVIDNRIFVFFEENEIRNKLQKLGFKVIKTEIIKAKDGTEWLEVFARKK